MALLDSRQINAQLRTNVAAAVAKVFPIVEGTTEINVSNVTITTPFDSTALQTHQEARLQGKDRTVPILADVELKRDGKVVQTRKQAKLGDLPLLSGFGSFVVGGNDYITHFAQLRLKPGLYTREATDGSFETTIHVAGSRITIWMEPAKGLFKMGVGTTNVNLLPILLSLGATKDQVVSSWGNDSRARDLYARNESKGSDSDISKLYEVVARLKVKKEHLRAGIVQRDEDAVNADISVKIQTIKAWLESKALDAYVTKKTTGQALSHAGLDALLIASKRVLEVQREGAAKADDRDAPEFKSAYDVTDMIPERIARLAKMWAYEVRNKIKRKPEATLAQLTSSTFINDGTIGYFLGSPGMPPGLANTAELPNPLAILANRDKMTITGPGGIQDAHSVTNEARLFRMGATGFVDPVQTVEGSNVGVTTHAAMYTAKVGNSLASPMYTVTNGVLSDDQKMVTAEEANESVVGLPESWDLKTHKPKGDKVRAIKDHQIYDTEATNVQYVIPSGFSMFGATSNAASFLAHTHANRGMMVGKHLTQTLPLVHREKPLAVSKNDFGEDYGASLGRQFAILSDTAGVVTKMEPGAIWVGEKKYEYFDRYPMQAKVTLHHEPRVKVGDTVKVGDVLADSNYTKDGVLAPGVNLRSAYTPWRNATNFEDAIVVSDSAAKLLTSEHTHTMTLWPLDDDTIVGTKEYVAQYPTKMDREKAGKLGADGVILEGQTVVMGDVLIAAVRKNTVDAQNRTAANYATIHKKLQRPFRDAAITWDLPFSGTAYRVVKLKDRINVYIETQEPLQVGDKLSNGAAAKGTISEIIPDDKMPQDEKGRPIQIILNPHGVAGRINPGQTIEQAAGKLVRDGGKTYEYSHFDGRDHASEVAAALKEAGLKHEEILYDPITGKHTELPVAVGYNYMFKLDHSVRKKFSARARAGYTQDEMPNKGSGKSAQSFDGLTTAALLGHNAHALLGESFGIRGTKNDDFWEAFQAGELPPPPKVPYAFHKFEALLNAAGIHTSKDDRWMHFAPLTSAQVLARSNGEVTDSRMIRAKNLSEHENGLFDVKKTGGLNGSDWTHINLAEKMPHPLHEKVIRDVAEIKGADYLGLIAHTRHFDPRANKFADEPSEHTLTGAKAFEHLLTFDQDAKLADFKRRAKTAVGSDRNKMLRAARYVEGLKSTGLDAKDAYLTDVLPVLPPKYRPLIEQQSGGLRVADANVLYRDVLLTHKGLTDAKAAGLPESELTGARVAAYDAVAGLVGVGAPLSKRRDNQELVGFVQAIKGKSAKEGLFQQTVSRRRNDYSARSTIEPGADLGPDEVSLPEDMAWEIYKAVGIRRLSQAGINPADALDAWEKRTLVARDALNAELADRPVVLNRSPSLHKGSVLAQWARIHDGKAIKINSQILGPTSGDYDGDTMSVVVPITDAAKIEATNLLPSKNLFYERDRSIAFGLEKDIITGLFMLTRGGQPSGKSYDSAGDAIKAYENNKDGLRMTSVVDVPDHQAKPTVGQLIFEDMVPARFRSGVTYPLDGKKLEHLLRTIADTSPGDYNRIVRALSTAGFEYSARSGGITGTVNELIVNRTQITKLLDTLEGKIRGAGSPAAAKMIAKQYFLSETKPALEKVVGAHLEQIGLGGDVFFKAKPSAKLGFDSFMQMLASPTLVTDVKGEVIPSVIRSSYGGGMRAGDYLMTTPGARAGMVAKSLSTALPGYLSKEIVANVANVRISEIDCGTHHGLTLKVAAEASVKGHDTDILDRHLGADVSGFKRNDVVTPRMLEELRKANVHDILVRSPMTCESLKPPCQMCAPVHPDGRVFAVGDNIGYDFGQSVGERSTQQVLKSTAGLVTTAAGAIPFSMAWANVGGTVTHEDGYDVCRDPKLTVEDWEGPVAVTAAERHAKHAPVYLITTKSGDAIIVQGDHPMWVYRGQLRPGFSNINTGLVGDSLYHCTATSPRTFSRTEFPAPEEVRADALTKEDCLWIDWACAKAPETPVDPSIPGWLAGYYAGDGCVRVGNGRDFYTDISVATLFSSKGTPGKPSAVEARINARLTRALVDMGLDPRGIERGTAVYSPAAAARFEALIPGRRLSNGGRPAHGKSLWWNLSTLSDEWLSEFMSGLIDTDGTIVEQPAATVVSFTSTSFELASIMLFAARRFGYRASCQVVDNCPCREAQWATAFTIELRFPRAPALSSERFVSSRQRVAPQPYRAPVRGYVPIGKIRRLEQWNGWLYDVKTPTVGYMAGGIRNHNSFHSGGTVGSGEGLNRGFARLTELLRAPESAKDQGTLAEVAGTVSSIIAAPQGGHDVTVAGVKHYVGTGRELKVKLGQHVEAGDALSDGNYRPQDLARLKGTLHTQQYLVNEMREAFAQSGTVMRKPVLEVVAASVGRFVEITDDGGAPGVTAGEILHENEAAALKKTHPKLMWVGTMPGLSSLPAARSKDPLERLNFHHLEDTLRQIPAMGGKSDLRGEDSPIAGLAYGAMFRADSGFVRNPAGSHP